MAGRARVLLLDSDDNVVKDVTYSLRLVKLDVEVVSTVLDAKKSVVREKPGLVLARHHLPGEQNAAHRLAAELSEHPDYAELTVVGLYDAPAEIPPEKPAPYFEAFVLPVEFPVFTRKVEELLSRSKVRATGAESARLAREAGERERLSRGLQTAHLLQQQALELVKAELMKGPIEDVPGCLLEATRKVCGGGR